MTSGFSHTAAAASESHLLHAQPSVLHDHRIPGDSPQSASDPPAYCTRAAGVLKYNRESDYHRMNVTTSHPANMTEFPVECEYCGKKAKPSLDLKWTQQSGTVPLYCCAQRQQLCEALGKRRCLARGRCDPKPGAPTTPRDESDTEAEELLFQGREMEDHNKFTVELPCGLGEQTEPKISEDYSFQLPVPETMTPTSKVLSFRLSCAPGSWIVCPGSSSEKDLKTEEEEELVPLCDHNSLQFGLCYHKGVATFLQKYYPSGSKFLTAFPDGSAQMFYPSGLLAVAVVTTKENGRVCIVYDDSGVPNQPIRAVFQSDGRATCYHSNGNIWLSINRSGGQCLDEGGGRVRRWSWSGPRLTPTPLHPVFLSLNRSVGVRVLGRERVFVSFLARGQQAKLSVGTCCAQGECRIGPSLMKEELFLLAARTRIHLAIQQLHQSLMTPANPRPPKAKQPPRHCPGPSCSRC